MQQVTSETILAAMRWRYAVKIFNPNEKLPDEVVHTILEAGRLSPSSTGIEPWQFIVVENPEVRARLRKVSYDQPKVTDASHLIVIARRTNGRETIVDDVLSRTAEAQGVSIADLAGLRGLLEGGVNSRDDVQLDAWVRAQTYLPLGIMVEAAALLGVDAGPMEGFDPNGVDEVLGLAEKHLASTTMLALGRRGDDPAAARPKVRREFEDVVTFIR